MSDNQESIDFSDPYITCHVCGVKVLRGVVNYANHWVETHGKADVEFIQKLSKLRLLLEDKMDLVKKQFGVDQ